MVTRQGRNYLWILKRYKMSSAWRKISLHYSYLTLFFCSKLTETNEGLEFCYHGTCVDWAPGWHALWVCEKWKSWAPIPDLTESHVHIKPEMHCPEERELGNPPVAEIPPQLRTRKSQTFSNIHHFPKEVIEGTWRNHGIIQNMRRQAGIQTQPCLT